MTQGLISGKEWLTLKEASDATGKSLNALRLLVHRKKIERVKKIVDNGRSFWLIHRDTLDLPMKRTEEDMLSDDTAATALEDAAEVCHDEIFHDDFCEDQRSCSDIPVMQVAHIPLEHYEQQRLQWLSERDSLMQGLMMYRFKYEEIERQIKLLPAPPDVMGQELKWKDEMLSDAQKLVQEKNDALAEGKRILLETKKNFEDERVLRDRIEMKMKAELEREKNRSWWKKLLGLW